MMPFRPRTRRRSLHADEEGQISLLGVMAAAAFACLLLLVINTGYKTNAKIELQNAADLTAISGANWVARGLNVISLNNVTETQLVAFALILPALDSAMGKAEKVLQLEMEAALLIPFVGEVLAAAIEIQLEGLVLAHEGVTLANQSLGGRGGVLWQAAVVLGDINAWVRGPAGFFLPMHAESIRVAAQNGASAGALIPAEWYNLGLPAHAADMKVDFCDPLRSGSHSPTHRGYSSLPEYGYEVNKGPLEHYADKLNDSLPFKLVINSFLESFFNADRDREYLNVCGGTVAPRPKPVDVRDSACFVRGLGDGVWGIAEYDTKPYDKRQSVSSIERKDRSGPARTPLTPIEVHQCPWTPPPPFEKVDSHTWREAREFPVYSRDANNNVITRWRYEVREYIFSGAKLKNDDQPSGATYDRNPLPSDFPKPYLLGFRRGDTASAARRQLRYLAVVYRKQTNVVAPHYFQSPIGDSRVAYGQARVYNPTAYDAFTQDWRVSLEPATLLEEGTLLGFSNAPSSAAGGTVTSGLFGVLLRWVGNFSSSVVSLVNNH